ncbi:MAG: alginate lyase family protein [Salinivirgaceae bacterium]|jgi:hypothetical protein|nr:alginate lyase family protein [Salinivirgaceae bacterium]
MNYNSIQKSLLCTFILFLFFSIITKGQNYKQNTIEVLTENVLTEAAKNLNEKPITITSYTCDRSAGSKNDFYSEGDYWWPNPNDINGPYIRKDGLTNPDNFTEHRKAMLRLSIIVGNLTSAYLITKDTSYVSAAKTHLKAWFISDSTQMNPNLLYAQAIKGRHTGRGIGIIDAIHLIEVVKSVMIFDNNSLISEQELANINNWFTEFTLWLSTHKYGLDEMVHPNNHGTCWNMQVAMFAKFTQNDTILNFCRENFKNKLMPNQMATNGSFPLELKRTKPYGYSLFNLDAMVMNCMILSDEQNDLWNFELADGRSIQKAIAYMAPYVKDKTSWPLEPDVMYWENWPVAQPAFIFGALKFNNELWFELWKNNKHSLEVEEVLRNVPIRNPLLWLE